MATPMGKGAVTRMRSRRPRVWLTAGALACLLACSLLGGCFESRYVVQASFGQLELWGKARPIGELVGDRRTDPRTRVLLEEVRHIRRFARSHGLEPGGSYRNYVPLNRPAVVWFLAASRPLSLEPKLWNFPVVGSFPYTGWFDAREARKIAAMLRRQGWETFLRPVSAYSTGGWFRDPVVSSMFSPREDALRTLANVLLHELTHANILMNDQSTYNESIASFVGDTMAEQYVLERFGPESAELAAFRLELAEDRRRGARMAAAYEELDTLYRSKLPDAEKLARKRKLLAALDAELELPYRPNNASLLGFKTYNAGLPEFAALYEACGKEWPRFFASVRTLVAGDFPEPQEEDIGPIIARLVAADCPDARAGWVARGGRRGPAPRPSR
jgi:predicted aminopeptidase